jgi:hypothetical protein
MASVLLSDLILEARRLSDHETDTFVTDLELVSFANDANLMCYDEVILADEGYFVEPSSPITVSSGVASLPDDCYKLIGVDYAKSGRYVTLRRIPFAERNRYSGSLAFGDLPRYYLKASSINLVPAPTSCTVVLQYVPYPTRFTAVSDSVTEPIAHWSRYIVYHMAAMILQKEESDPSIMLGLRNEAMVRIRTMAKSRDMGEPMRVIDDYGMEGNDWWYT